MYFLFNIKTAVVITHDSRFLYVIISAKLYS